MSTDLERWHDTPCLNCGHLLEGDYCAGCGQRATDIDRPLTTLFTDFAEGFFSFEHSVWQTLRALLFKPGRLTQAYLAGRRISYMSPIRLYLVSSLFFFGVIGLTSAGVNIEGDVVDENGETVFDSREEVAARVDSTQAVARGESAGAAPDSNTASRGFWSGVGDRVGEKINSDPDAFVARFMSWVPRFMFLLVPLSALVLKLMYIRHKRPLLHFLVFALHIHAVFFLIMAVAMPLGELDRTATSIAGGLFFLTVPVNVFIAQRRVFGGGRLKTLVKMFLVWNIYGILLALVVFAALALVLFLP